MSEAPTSQIIARAVELNKQMADTVDGFPRSKEKDADINQAVFRVLKTEAGEVMFDWIRQITVNKVLGANATPGELAYQEGMRALAALINQRFIAHERVEMRKAEKR